MYMTAIQILDFLHEYFRPQLLFHVKNINMMKSFLSDSNIFKVEQKYCDVKTMFKM